MKLSFALMAMAALTTAMPAAAQRWAVEGDYHRCTAGNGTILLNWHEGRGLSLMIVHAGFGRWRGGSLIPLSYRFTDGWDNGFTTRSETSTGDIEFDRRGDVIPMLGSYAVNIHITSDWIGPLARANILSIIVEDNVAAQVRLNGSRNAIDRFRQCLRRIDQINARRRGERSF